MILDPSPHQPRLGDVLLYTLTLADANDINDRCHPDGNHVRPGQEVPLVVTCVPGSMVVNGVMLTTSGAVRPVRRAVHGPAGDPGTWRFRELGVKLESSVEGFSDVPLLKQPSGSVDLDTASADVRAAVTAEPLDARTLRAMLESQRLENARLREEIARKRDQETHLIKSRDSLLQTLSAAEDERDEARIHLGTLNARVNARVNELTQALGDSRIEGHKLSELLDVARAENQKLTRMVEQFVTAAKPQLIQICENLGIKSPFE